MNRSFEDLVLSLKEGNQRFVAGKSKKAIEDAPKLAELAQLPAPQIAVVACADSRVSPEIIFDMGIGDLFVVRGAANRVSLFGLATLEFGVAMANSKLIVVVGHTGCLAIRECQIEQEWPSPHIASLMNEIKEDLKDPGEFGCSIKSNAHHSALSLVERSTMIASRISEGKLKVVPVVYDVFTGGLEWLPEIAPSTAQSFIH